MMKGRKVSSAAIKAPCMMASRARQNKAPSSTKKADGCPAIDPAGRPLDRGRGTNRRKVRDFRGSAGLFCQFAAPRNPMGMTRRRPEMGILLGESVNHQAADLERGVPPLRTRLSMLLVASRVAFTSATLPMQAAEPTVAGLWQKQDESGKSMGWFLFVERNGVFEGAFAKLFARPGDAPNPTCTGCTDDRRNAPLL